MKMFGKSKGGGRRAAPRETTPLVAVLTSLTRSHGAVLVDVSCTGARFRGADLPKANEQLVVTIQDIRAFATVAWSEHGQCGAEFDPALQPEDVEKLREDVARTAGVEPHMKAAADAWILGAAR